MDRHTTLIQRFRHIISLASLAYAFTILHALQYSMRDQDNLNDDDDGTAQTATNFSASSTHDTVDTPPTASTSENVASEKANSRWTDDEIKLLLDFVEANCVLTTNRGLSLKKSQFTQAHATVKTKDASQCHYKWGRVIFFSFYQQIITVTDPPL
jgi:hypothetical protein